MAWRGASNSFKFKVSSFKLVNVWELRRQFENELETWNLKLETLSHWRQRLSRHARAPLFQRRRSFTPFTSRRAESARGCEGRSLRRRDSSGRLLQQEPG